LLSLFLGGCGSNVEPIVTPAKKDTKIDFNKYIEIINIELDNEIQPEQITEVDGVKIKLKNISNKIIYGVSLWVHYLDKEKRPIAKATAFYKFQKIQPGEIVVWDNVFIFVNPQDVKNIWNGEFGAEILDIVFEERKELKTNKD